MLKRFALGLAVILIAAISYVYMSYGSIARAGSGYAAKNLCSGHFLSGFPLQTVQDEALIGASETLANVSYAVDTEARSVTTKLYGLFERRAVFTPGIGCTLLSPGETAVDMGVIALPPLELSPEFAWPMGSAAPQLTDAYDDLLDAAFAEDAPGQPKNTKAITISHDGKLVAERYADGVSPDTPLIGWSMAKSVTALMVGVLVADEALVVDAPANVPQWQTESDDPRAAITLDQLLRQSSGLEFNETYEAETDVTHMLSNEPDTAAFAASKPLIGDPDTIWSYSSGTTNIISGIIRRTVGDTLQDYYTFSQTRLFRPLGIRTATFEADRSGNFIGSSYLYASARDWARLGQFTLQDGVWAGERRLPEGWVTYLTTPTPTTPGNEYGAQVWLNRNPDDPDRSRLFPTLPEDMYYFGGFQGQMVIVIPSERLVITRFGFTPARNHGVEELAASVIARLPDLAPDIVEEISVDPASADQP
ncbi:MAG: serine hydrolase [Pseudomonadota bacterium]